MQNIRLVLCGILLCFLTNPYYSFINEADCRNVHTIYKNTHIRKGPGYDYPVFFKIKNTKNYPFKELLTYGDWVKVIDFENSTGWVYKNLITHKKESVIFVKPGYLYSKPKLSSAKIALIGKHNTAIAIKTHKNFIFVFVNGVKGWTPKSNCWPHK